METRTRRLSSLLLATAVLVACTAVLVACVAGTAAGSRGSDASPQRWQQVLSRDDVRFPAIGPIADAQVSAKPLYLQIAYVAGAIGGWGEPDVCPLLDRDPRGFDRAASHEIFKSPADYHYIQAHGWSVSSVLATYREGVRFGCSHS
jgi:hypothetical protein